MTFFNRRYFQKQKFEILGKTLKIHKKGIFDEIEYEVPLESIHNKKTIQTQIDNNLIVIGVFFFAFGLLFLLGDAKELLFIFSSIGLIFIIASFINRKKVVRIPTYATEPIIMHFRRNNKNDVVYYADQIIEASNNYLLKKYNKLDRSLPVEPQIENLKFLLDREVITEDDFESLKNKLLGREGKSSIGFSQ